MHHVWWNLTQSETVAIPRFRLECFSVGGPGLGYSYSVLVLAVLEYWISGTRTREFESHSTRTCTRTRGQVLRYSYEGKGENHHTCEINSMTYQKGKVPNLFCYNLNIWYMGCDCKFHTFFQFYHHWKIHWITIFIFIVYCPNVVIRPSPVSHSTSGYRNIWKFLLQTWK